MKFSQIEIKACLTAGLACVSLVALAADRSAVHIDASAVGPRPLEEQTQASVIRGYLDAWSALSSALADNRTDVLDRAFVGLAKQKLSETVQQQAQAGLQTHYQDLSHNITLLFYSPEGMSIQLVDNVQYEVQIIDHGHRLGTERVRTRYVSVLTPTEVRWKVRILQAAPE